MSGICLLADWWPVSVLRCSAVHPFVGAPVQRPSSAAVKPQAPSHKGRGGGLSTACKAGDAKHQVQLLNSYK